MNRISQNTTGPRQTSTPATPTSATRSTGGPRPESHEHFQESPELGHRAEKGSGRDLHSLKAAFGNGLMPSDEEFQVAQARGKSGDEMKADRQKDLETVRHVCGEGCGCKPKIGDDPLKSLRQRDEEVRKHEDDHLREAGEFAKSGPRFKEITASDGKSYVVSGEVSVDVGEIKGNPKKTIEKMKQIERAALKPEEPSDKDREVHRKAMQKRLKAEKELHSATSSHTAP